MLKNHFSRFGFEALLLGMAFVCGGMAYETFRPALPVPQASGGVQVEMPLARRPVLVFEGFRFRWLDAEKLIIQLEPLPPVVEPGVPVEAPAPEMRGPIT